MRVALRIEKPMLRQYIEYLFPRNADTGLLVCSYANPLGRQLLTFASTSLLPVPPESEDCAVLDLPRYSGLTERMEDHFLYYDSVATKYLNLTLESLMDVDFRLYYARGRSARLRKKDIVEAYVLSRNLAGETFDALHKRVYRQEQAAAMRLARYFRKRADYIDQMLDKTGLQ